MQQDEWTWQIKVKFTGLKKKKDTEIIPGLYFKFSDPPSSVPFSLRAPKSALVLPDFNSTDKFTEKNTLIFLLPELAS